MHSLTLGFLDEYRSYRIPLVGGANVALVYEDFIEKTEFLAYLLEKSVLEGLTVVWVNLEGKALPLLEQLKSLYRVEYGLFDLSGVLGVPVGLKPVFMPSVALLLNLDDKCFRKIVGLVKYGDLASVIKAVKKTKCRYEDLNTLIIQHNFRDFSEISMKRQAVYMLPYFNDKTLRYAYALALYLIQSLVGKPLIFLMEESYLLADKKYAWSLLNSPPNYALYLHSIPIEYARKVDLRKFEYIISLSKASAIVSEFLKTGKVEGCAVFERRGERWRVLKIKRRHSILKIEFSNADSVKEKAKFLTYKLYGGAPPRGVPLVDPRVLDLSMKTILAKAILNLAGAYVLNYVNVKTGYLANKLLTAYRIFEWARRKVEPSERE